jgi:hypothetical protein
VGRFEIRNAQVIRLGGESGIVVYHVVAQRPRQGALLRGGQERVHPRGRQVEARLPSTIPFRLIATSARHRVQAAPGRELSGRSIA